MRDKFSTYSRTTVRLDKDLDRFVEEVARFAGVQKQSCSGKLSMSSQRRRAC